MIDLPGIDPATLSVAALAAGLALHVGYLVGSVPLSALIGRAAGVDVVHEGEANPGSANVWKLAGPGWGLLALTGDLAKGVLPVVLGTVTVSWSIGWVAGLGALLGACWPLFGRLPGGRGVAVFAGAAFALSPSAGTLAVLLTLSVLVAARLFGRNGRVAAIATGVGSYPLLFLAVQGDLPRLAALMTLYLVTVLRYVTTRR
ncbi:MAG TPA: glycerol-3-phosphate acyltransferase [Candidatus Limnocylindrales bacterium]|nr:glycerol-3-phosphate acyltransferase [Candidatus Limnocylindrales bacterium]